MTGRASPAVEGLRESVHAGGLVGPVDRKRRARGGGAEQHVVARSGRSAAPLRLGERRAGLQVVDGEHGRRRLDVGERRGVVELGIRIGVVREHVCPRLCDEDRPHAAVVVLRPREVDLARAHAPARAFQHCRDVVGERGREVAGEKRDAQAAEAALELRGRSVREHRVLQAPPRRRCARSTRPCRSSGRRACSRRAGRSRRSA